MKSGSSHSSRTPTWTGPERIESIDYLRGVLALSVALFHYYSWTGYYLWEPLHGVIYRTGIYAVLMFYVISGISFGYVYKDLSLHRVSLFPFWIKRYFRLAPLYIFAMISGVLVMALKTDVIPSWSSVIMNITLTFGILAPHEYLVTGGWSIGNEMFYYTLFPIVIIALRHSYRAYAIILIASVATGALYAFNWIDSSAPLDDSWLVYIEPMSHFFYFVSGVGLSELVRRRPVRLRSWSVPLGITFLLLYSILAATDGHSDNVVAVTGWRWGAYSLFSICGVGALCQIRGRLPGYGHKVFSLLGRLSYSVYLMHPIAWMYSQDIMSMLQLPIPTVTIALPLTLVSAHVLYRYVESPMISLGRRVADFIRLRMQTRHNA